MKTLLQKVASGLYFQGPDQWTSNPEKAFNFKSIDHALEFVGKWRLDDVELAFAFKGGHQVKRIPLEKVMARYAQD
jgi:hypothetical protein